MNVPRYARLAAQLLQRESDSLPRAAPPTRDVRDAAVAAMERVIAMRGRRRRLRRVTYASLATAAVIGLTWVTRSAFQEASTSNRSTATTVSPHALDVVVHAFGGAARISGNTANGDRIGAGGRVQAANDGRVLLAFTTGTRVSLEPSGDLTLVDNGTTQLLALNHGALRADVAKLAPGRRFLVHTADSEVEVHGTSFRVSIAEAAESCSIRTLTRVEVFEGVVAVRSGGSEHRIEKGDQWLATCPTPAAPTRVPAAGVPTATPQAESGESARPGAPAPRANPPGPRLHTQSELTEQNDAFAAAVAAEHSGDLERAVRGFDLLLARYPNGPLAESAAVQRLKLTHRFDQPRAHELAREYLRRYPSGFAREQALTILSESP